MSARSYRVLRKRDGHSEGVVTTMRKARALMRSLEGRESAHVALRLTPRRRTSKNKHKGWKGTA